jgi:hypothetical protein
MISVYSSGSSMYEHCGSDPLDPSVTVAVLDSLLKLKCRLPLLPDLLTNHLNLKEKIDGKGFKRTKEKKIGFIIEKVARWRNLYNGVVVRGETLRMTLDEAALHVGISKKSLDDYLLQLRFGRRFGFNFNEHRHDRVGLLRTYVKQSKKLQAELAKVRDGNISEELKDKLAQNRTPSCKAGICCALPTLHNL